MSARDNLKLNPFRQTVLDCLKRHSGEMLSAYSVAQKTKMTQPTARQELTELEDMGLIRRGGSRSGATWYIPSAAQIEAEGRQLTMLDKPLQPRHDHRARIEAIRAERAQYPSKF